MMVDTLDHLFALRVTPASAKNRGEVERLAAPFRLAPAIINVDKDCRPALLA